MVHRFAIAYYYATPTDLERMNLFRSCSGDTEKGLITQYVRGWIGKNRKDYFEPLARLDADARGISYREWGETVVLRGGVDALPEYEKELKNIPEEKLNSVTLTPDVKSKPLNYINLGTQNLAFLKVGIHYSRDSAIVYVSKIVKEHLSRNWDTLYQPQIDAENWENWK